ncbi:MAG: hypothetical protein KKD77_23980 [Gammaproteobacteria bacterium]|nr:hypothetical protein [Gammaproteobacteria bacterium]
MNNAYGDPIKNEKGKTVRYEPREWVDAVWFGDSRWYEWHVHDLKRFPGLIAHCAVTLRSKSLMHFDRGKPSGIETDPSKISWNSNSGASAINFAYHLGVRRVVLLGYDMKFIDGKSNWHDDHPNKSESPYWRFIRAFFKIANDAKMLGLEIINATPGSALTNFPIMSLQEYLTQEAEEARYGTESEGTNGVDEEVL